MISTPHLADAVRTSRKIARRVTAMAQNRLELLCLEVREERERIERALVFLFGAGISVLLAAGTLVALVVLVVDERNRLWALGGLAAVFILSAAGFVLGLDRLRRDWKTLEETRAQFRRDREDLEKLLE
jgi:uncharacterized membrane protein YqjE